MIIRDKEEMLKALKARAGERYEWSANPGFDFSNKADANQVAACLEEISLENNGIVTTEMISREGDKPTSPLYALFERDLEMAAAKYRLIEVRNMVGSLIVVRVVEKASGENQEFRIRAFQNVTENGTQGYCSTKLVVTVTDLRDQVIEKLKAEILRWKEKAKEFDEFAHIVSVINTIA